MMMMSFILWFLLVIGILVGMSFFTLLERKILGYIQFRKGPNKISFGGILQPFSDAVKLISKMYLNVESSNFMMFFFSPMLGLFLSIVIWCSIPYLSNFLDLNLCFLFFLCCLSASVYGIFLGGWASNSKFSYIGSVRAVAQSISYEVSLAMIMLIPIFMVETLNFVGLVDFQKNFYFFYIMIFVFLSWMISILAETNRAPFDFAEGESELVSGFNIEYGGMAFGMFFMSEYVFMLVFSYITLILFFGMNFLELKFIGFFILILIFILWVRASLPRFRYDFLMYLCWKGLLPLILYFLLYFITWSYLLN